MLAVISPAKSLDFETSFNADLMSTARMLDHSTLLAKRAAQLSLSTIKALMDLSDPLAALNYQRFQTLDLDAAAKGQKPAMLAFNGDVYTGLDAHSFDEPGLLRAQSSLRILSGLYGLLRPLDGIQPYRLEMGRALDTQRGKTLYAFWDTLIAEQLNQDLEETHSSALINLASQEYFKAVKIKTVSKPIITPEFKELREGKLKIISFSAKRARGLMARFIIDQDLKDPEALKSFDYEGYSFDPDQSTPAKWLFVRPDQRQAA